MNWQSAKLPTLSHLEFHTKVIEGLAGNVRNKMIQKRGRPSSAAVEYCLNGKLHLIQAHDGKVKMHYAVCSNREVKGGRTETTFYCDMCPRKPGLHTNECFVTYHRAMKYRLVCSYKYFISDKVTEKISHLSSRKLYSFIITFYT
jgi:hypothetical protein